MLSWSDELLSLFEGGSYYNGGCVIVKGIKEYIAISSDVVGNVVALVEQQESLNVALQLENERHAFRFPLDTAAYKSWGVLPHEAINIKAKQKAAR